MWGDKRFRYIWLQVISSEYFIYILYYLTIYYLIEYAIEEIKKHMTAHVYDVVFKL